MKRSRLAPLAIALLGSIAIPALHAAAPPPQMNYQGVLRDAAGNPRTGSFAMTFRFFDAPAAGNEILVDTHGAGQEVSVDGGLFDVVLGGGTLSDGAAALPGDPYTSLSQVFRDFTNVWLQISVGAETLMPRVQVLSAAYALNASHLNGQASGNFLDTSNSAQTKQGGLTLGGLTLRSTDLRLNAAGADATQRIYFREDANDQGEVIAWDDALDAFSVSDQLDVQGRIRLRDQFFASIDFSDGVNDAACRVSYDSPDQALEVSTGIQTGGALMVGNTTNLPPAYNRFGSGGTPDSGVMATTGDVYLQNDLEVDGSLYLSGSIRMDDTGPDGTQYLYFYDDGSPTNESLRWDDANDRFTLSNALAVGGPVRVGYSTGGDVLYNHFGPPGTGTDLDWVDNVGDVYIEEDLEVDRDAHFSGNVFMKHSGVDANQYLWFFDGSKIDDEWLSWDDASDRFEFSDSLHVFGELTALTKNFVQNHPTREDLELVFTSLEGDESTVFTRGHGRLEDGFARIPLSEPFSMVVNGSIGLSAYLTPRGAWSDLYVVSLTGTTLEVRSKQGAPDVAFDYIVYGLRAGYEEFPVVRARRSDAPLPAPDSFAIDLASKPEAAASTAQARFTAMHRAAFDREPPPAVPPAPTKPDPIEPASQLSVVTARSFQAEGSSTAGTHRAAAPVVPGDVLVIDGDLVRRSDRSEDARVVGIAVAEGGVVLGGDAEDGAWQVNVAMSGIAVCNVDPAFGTIEPGDLLVSSPTPGFAMKAKDPLPGTVIGKALQRAEIGQPAIRVLVMQR